ncbi:hypothetical protein F3N42_11015 [Marinihelvus fidelis]|uniref:Uncharacterized protein n=1 Tax=Marinihelvus fidelis TaxID=2613842 RepID=A0A5N0T8S8_9GAMM|nr:hypothetical protein [Marinihelvus fidelis]KAA9130884.1 hypothetical protein F3N42_11015 [Marinihelvus fidelis]
MPKKKRMSKKSRRWLQDFRNHYYEFNSDRAEVADSLKEGSEKALDLFRTVPPWGELYSVPPGEIVVSFFVAVGFQEKLYDLLGSDRSLNSYQEFFKGFWEGEGGEMAEDRLDAMPDDERGDVLALLFAMVGNMDGLKSYYNTIYDLIKLVEEGGAERSRKAFFQAIATDRAAVGNSVIAKRICLAQIANDTTFMGELSKAITRTIPKRKKKLDDFRYMAEVIDEIRGLRTYSIEDLTDVFTNTLEVLPKNISSDSVKKNLQDRRVAKRGSESAV